MRRKKAVDLRRSTIAVARGKARTLIELDEVRDLNENVLLSVSAGLGMLRNSSVKLLFDGLGEYPFQS